MREKKSVKKNLARGEIWNWLSPPSCCIEKWKLSQMLSNLWNQFFFSATTSKVGDWKVKSTWWWLNLLELKQTYPRKKSSFSFFFFVLYKKYYARLHFLFLTKKNHIYKIKFNPAARDLMRERVEKSKFCWVDCVIVQQNLWCIGILMSKFTLIISWKLLWIIRECKIFVKIKKKSRPFG